MRMNQFAVAILALMVVSLSSSGWAQVPEAPEEAALAAGDTKPTPWREQTIYIPYKQLQKVFEEQGRGVFLPYEKFQELWKKAQASEPQPVDNRPPVGAIVTEIASEATVERE